MALVGGYMQCRFILFCTLVWMTGCTQPVAPAECQGHEIGSSFPAADGCNTCICEASGVSCTEMACPMADAGTPDVDGGEITPDAGAHPVDGGTTEADVGGGSPQTCGTRGAQPCPAGSFCNHPIEANCGRTDQPGVCEPVPEACNRRLDPVCGCDGQTYDNACEAARAEVSVAAQGRCPDGCTDNRDCDRGAYCAKALGLCEEIGVCEQRPDVCGGVVDPVCGCDGQTYSNACAAAAVGVNGAHAGACEEDPPVCESNRDCPDQSYCHRPDGQCAEQGQCRERPDRCTPSIRWVCGCDGETYRNACLAQSAGTTVAQAGPCDDADVGEAGDVCDSERPCGNAFYCDLPDGQCAAEGVCVVRPEMCNRMMQPVCGCDGQNYSNPCVANSGGTSVNYAGDCR